MRQIEDIQTVTSMAERYLGTATIEQRQRIRELAKARIMAGEQDLEKLAAELALEVRG